MLRQGYTEVFIDSFFANFVLTFSKDFAFPSILFFDGYDHLIAAIYAILGSSTGLFTTFIIFYLIAKKFYKMLEFGSNYSTLQKIFGRYGFIISAIMMVPHFSILVPVFMGLVKSNIKTFFFYIILYRTFYYLMVLYV